MRACRDPLYELESVNSLLLGICERMSSQSCAPKEAPLFVSVMKDGKVAAAAVMTPPHNPILACLAESDYAATRELAGYLANGRFEITGITGPAASAFDFADAFTAIRGLSHSVIVKLRLYELAVVVHPSKKPGELRPAGLEGRALLIEWAGAFHAEATPNDPMMDYAEMIDLDLKQHSIFIWENEEGQPVSMVRKTRPTKNTISVNFVYTPPALRGRGYAAAAVADFSQLWLDNGYKRCVLFTDLSNPTSNSIYQKIGYTPVIDFDMYSFAAKL